MGQVKRENPTLWYNKKKKLLEIEFAALLIMILLPVINECILCCQVFYMGFCFDKKVMPSPFFTYENAHRK